MFIPFFCKSFFHLQHVLDILEGTDQRSCVEGIILYYCIAHYTSAKSFQYFTSKEKIPTHPQPERKQYDICTREKMIYIDIGGKSAPS